MVTTYYGNHPNMVTTLIWSGQEAWDHLGCRGTSRSSCPTTDAPRPDHAHVGQVFPQELPIRELSSFAMLLDQTTLTWEQAEFESGKKCRTFPQLRSPTLALTRPSYGHHPILQAARKIRAHLVNAFKLQLQADLAAPQARTKGADARVPAGAGRRARRFSAEDKQASSCVSTRVAACARVCMCMWRAPAPPQYPCRPNPNRTAPPGCARALSPSRPRALALSPSRPHLLALSPSQSSRPLPSRPRPLALSPSRPHLSQRRRSSSSIRSPNGSTRHRTLALTELPRPTGNTAHQCLSNGCPPLAGDLRAISFISAVISRGAT